MTLLAVESVTKSYVGRSTITAVNRASFDLASGELAVVFGMRLSGRTTLLKLAAGLVAPDSGRVTLDGVALAQVPQLGSRIGWCAPRLTVSHGRTVGDQLLAAALARHRSRRAAMRVVLEALERVDMKDAVGLDYESLYPHELALLGLARGVLHRPDVLVLDDPTLELDIKHRAVIEDHVRSLAREGYAVLVALTNTMRGADRTLRIHDGRLVGNTNPGSAAVVEHPSAPVPS